MRNYFLFILLAVFFSSCERFYDQVVEIDPPEYEKALVFHQFMSQKDSTVRITLSRTYGILETVPTDARWLVTGATVTWWKNGQKILDLLPRADSAFIYEARLPESIQPGSTYQIVVSHPDYPTVTSTQQMPAAPGEITGIHLDKDAGTDGYGSNFSELEFTVKDPAGAENYYEIVMSRIYEVPVYIGQDPQGNFIYDTVAYQQNVYFDETFDPNIIFGFRNSVLLTDQFFDGQQYKFKGRFYENYYEGDSIPYTLTIRHVTRDYYYWSKSYQAKDNDDGNPFVEPVSVFNNLEHGLGIFGLYFEQDFEVE